MAFKEVQSGSNIKSYWPKKAAERQKGDSVEGYYRGSIERPGFSGGTDTLYLIESKEGMVGVNSNASISRKIEQVPQGTLVKIIFNGKQRNPKTGREYNDFSVLMDDADTAQTPTQTDEVDFGGLDF